MATSPKIQRQSMENSHPSLGHQPTSSNAHSLSRAVHERRAEYTRPQKLRIKIGSWNVAACPGTELDLKGWFGEGKGIDARSTGLAIDPAKQHNIESIEAQEARRNKKQSSIPKGEEPILPAGEEIGLYVLGLQEVVELASAKQYIGNVYTDSGPISKWRRALVEALPEGYTLVAEQQLSGLLQFIYASPELSPTISSVSMVTVGTGIMGYLGNKGGVATRIVLGETTRMVFVNAHLASGSEPANLERRCWDASQILQRASFDPISWAGVLDDKNEGIGEEDFAFWFGDLNFRLELPGEDIRRLLTLHTQGEYDLEKKIKVGIDVKIDVDSTAIHSIENGNNFDGVNTQSRSSGKFNAGDDESSMDLPDPDDFMEDSSQNPASLQATLDSLLPHDQLRHAQRMKKAFHEGWREGPIQFMPTYKYDVGSVGVLDSSEKKRAPSWCDRILYRTRRDKLEYDGKSQETELAKIKDAEMKARGMDHAGDDEDVLFDYNPDEDMIVEPYTSNDYDEYDEGEDDQPEEVVTKEGFIDRIQLDVYTSHQRVLSSDHKPLEAIFTLDYDAVVPELKSRVQQEVARELDKAENETRPGITIVVDHHSQDAEELTTDHSTIQKQPTGDVEGVNYGTVAYGQRKSRSITIANTSQVPATFAFVARLYPSTSDERISPPWLSIRFQAPEVDDHELELIDPKNEKTLNPGETLNVVLEVFIDDLALVRDLNNCKIELDDILILRVTDGRDHFIHLHGSWQQSCFARSIEELIHVPEGGVRALLPPRKPDKDDSAAPVNRGQKVYWSAPRELFKLTEAVELLANRVVADANMIETAQFPVETAGWPFDSHSWLLSDSAARENRRRYVLEALDADKELNNSFPAEILAIERLEIITEVLLAFLLSITDGIVPSSLWTKLETDLVSRTSMPLTDTEEIKTWVLDVLSAAPNHNISFVFLTSMLCKVANELAPVPKVSWRQSVVGGAKNGLNNVRRSLSWKNKGKRENGSGGGDDPAVVRREAVERAYAGVFAEVMFKGGEEKVGRERRAMDERRRDILDTFLKGGREG